VDEEAMKAGVHIVRNPHIYSRLADAGLATAAGSGIRRIIRLVRQHVARDLDISIKHEVKLTIPRTSGTMP
jgi:predicted HTH transcriptional regulator